MNTISFRKELVTRRYRAEGIIPIRYRVTLYTVEVSGKEVLNKLCRRVGSLQTIVQDEIVRLTENQYILHQEKIDVLNKQRDADNVAYDVALDAYNNKNLLFRLFVPKPQPPKEVDATFVPDKQLLRLTLLRDNLDGILRECLAMDIECGMYSKTSEAMIPLAYVILTTPKNLLNVDTLIDAMK